MSKKFFPELHLGFEDPRVQLHIGDGTFGYMFFLGLCVYNSMK